MQKTFIAVIFLLIIFSSCKENEPTAPEQQPPEILVSENIGPNGGIVATDDISLEIPSGAFDTETEIKISLDKSGNTYCANTISDVYVIEGLLADYKQSLTIKVKYNGELSGDNFLFLEEESYFPGKEEFKNSITLIDAIESEGFLESSLELNVNSEGGLSSGNNPLKIVESGKPVKVGATTKGLNKITTFGYFITRISTNYYSSISAQVETILINLEEMYLNLTGAYNLKHTPNPIPIIFADADIGVRYKYSHHGTGSIIIGVEFLKSTTLENLKNLLGKELLLLMLDTYDKRKIHQKFIEPRPHYYWLNQAFVEALYPSDLSDEDLMSPFNGFQNGYNINPNSHGKGMAFVLTYLLATFSKSTMGSVYRNIIENKMHPIAAIEENSAAYERWLPEFFTIFLQGDLRDSENIKTFFRTKMHRIKSIFPSEEILNVPEQYSDLSAKWFMFNIAGANESSQINFTLTGGETKNNALVVLRANDQKIEFLDLDDQKVTISNVKDLVDQNWNIMVLITNSRYKAPYTEKTDLNLAVAWEDKGATDFTKVRLSIKYVQELIKINTITGEEFRQKNEYRYSPEYWGGINFELTGSFVGNTFTAIYEHPDGYYKDTITAVLNDKRDKVISYKEKWESLVQKDDPNDYESYELLNIPILSRTDDEIVFSVLGSPVCQHIVLIDYYYYDPVLRNEYMIEWWECNADSYIYISFNK